MKHHKAALLIPIVMLLLSIFSIQVIALDSPAFDSTGPYVETVVYTVINDVNDQVQALLNDEIDLIGNRIDSSYVSTLEADSDIAISAIPRNGYGELIFRCDKYPLNFTAFRRAAAMAISKTTIVEDIFDGYAVPQDSPIPAINDLSIEGQLSYDYYDADIAAANTLLDNAGFFDSDADGFREAPDGTDFTVTIIYVYTSRTGSIVSLVADDLRTIGFDVDLEAQSYTGFLPYLNNHHDFDVLFYETYFEDLLPTFLETEYGSDYYNIDYSNPSSFENDSFDALLPQMFYSPSYEDSIAAVSQLQEILVYECPSIMLYSDYDITAYRTDAFENHVVDVTDNVKCFWTNLKVKLKTSEAGLFEGTFRIGTSFGATPISFNHMNYASLVWQDVLDNTDVSLFKRGPNGAPIPWLAKSYTMETHSDNDAVPSGHTRFTFDLIETATWTDGSALNGTDVAFSFNYYYSTLYSPYWNAYGLSLIDLSTAYSPSTFSAVVEFATESYWLLESFAYLTIIPSDVFQDIGLDGWDTWNPILTDDPYVTAGPFQVTDYEADIYTELTYNPAFFNRPSTISTTTPPTSPTSPTSPLPPLDPAQLAWIAGVIVGIAIIPIAAFVIMRRR